MINKELIQEVLKRVDNEECMHVDELQDIKFIMFNDLVRYHLNDILTEKNIQISNQDFEKVVTNITNYEGDFTKDLLLSISL